MEGPIAGSAYQIIYKDASNNSTGSDSLTYTGNVSGIGTVGIGTIIDIIHYDNLNGGTLSWEASVGQLFSITNNLASGSIFSVNDISGIPSIDVIADGRVIIAAYNINDYVGIGLTNPSVKLDVNGNTRLRGGLYDFNNSVGVANSILVSTGAGVSWTFNQPRGGGTDKIFYENDNVVTTDYTITSGKNAMTAGPITINSGVTVTIPSGSEWSIV